MLLSLHPSNTLGFPRPFTQNVNRTLKISNYNAQPVAFKVKTTAPNRYCVKPNSGRLKSGQTVELQVTLLAMEEEPPLSAKCKDKFMVQSVTITPEKKNLSLSDLWKTADIKAHSQKIKVAYISSEQPTVKEEEEPAPVPPLQSSVPNPAEQQPSHTTNGHSAPPIPDPNENHDHASPEETHEVEPAPVVNVTAHPPPPRQPTPQPSREQDPHENLVGATGVNRLSTPPPTMPRPGAKEEPYSEKMHRRTPSTAAGANIEVTSHVDVPSQSKGVPFPQKRPDSPVVSEPSRGFPSPPSEPVSTDPQLLSKSTPTDTDRSTDPPNFPVLSEDQGASPGTETNPPTNLDESAGQDGGERMQPPEYSRTGTRSPTQDEDDSRSSDEQGDRLSRSSSLNKGITSGEDAKSSHSPTTFSVLPQAPENSLSREDIVNEIADLTDQTLSVALTGSVGIGKSFVALALLHHHRTEAKFGQNRYFMRCDDLDNSLEGFLVRLSDTIQTDVTQLKSHLRSSPPFILLLDGVDSTIDPLTSQSQEVSATIEEFGNYENFCLVTTSRMRPDIRGFHRIEVPTLPENSARDTFYGLCDLPRSSAVDSLVAKLDFHPLAIELLASRVRENDWDEPTLLKAWDDDQISVLKTNDYQRVRDAIEPVLRSSAINRLGTSALYVLGSIAASPCGIEERGLEKEMTGTGEVVDVLCKFSLVYRQGGIVNMVAPVRSYFLELALVPAQREQAPCQDIDPIMPGAWLPKRYSAPSASDGGPSFVTPRLGAPPGWNSIRWLSDSIMRRLLAFLGHRAAPVVLVKDPTSMPPAIPEQHASSAPGAPGIDR